MGAGTAAGWWAMSQEAREAASWGACVPDKAPLMVGGGFWLPGMGEGVRNVERGGGVRMALASCPGPQHGRGQGAELRRAGGEVDRGAATLELAATLAKSYYGRQWIT